MYNKPTSIIVATVAEAKSEIANRLNNQPDLFFSSCNAACWCGDCAGYRGHDGETEIKVAICDVCANA